MRDIDFLPQEYRSRQVERGKASQRATVVLLAVAAVVAAFVVQRQSLASIERQLRETLPAFDAAMALNKQVADLQARLQAEDGRAELYTYLRHPWPRTQIVHGLTGELPDSITFQQVRIGREAAGTPPEPAADPQALAQLLAKMPAAVRDLKTLREVDRAPVVVAVQGVTGDVGSVHRYLDRLAAHPLVAKVELLSMDTDGGAEGGKQRFHAAVVLKPGFGQPGGPSAPLVAAAAAAAGGKP